MSSRRRFVNWLIGTGFGGLALSALYPVIRYLIPPPAAEAATNSVTLSLGPDDVPSNSGQIFKFGSRPGIVLRTPGGELRAFSAVCTHLGCTPNWLAGENKFKCPCHGSGFYMTGINFEGPAPRPLERYRVVLADDGQVLIDKTK